MTLSDIRLIFQIASVGVILAVIFLQIKRLKIVGVSAGYPVAILFWMLHALVFYIFVFLSRFDVYDIYQYIPSNTWSSALRFHAYVTILSIEISRLMLINFKKKEDMED